MRAIHAALVLVCVSCGPRAEDDVLEIARPDRTAAEPAITPVAVPPPEEPVSVSNVRLFTTASPGIYELALDETHLYWVTDGIFGPSEVWRASRDTGLPELLATSERRVYALSTDADHVYFVEVGDPPSVADSGSVARVPKSGGAVELVVTACDNPTSVAVDDSHVYFTRGFSPGGAVLRAPKAGGEPEVVLGDIDNPWQIALDTEHVYVSEMNAGQIVRAAKDATSSELVSSGWYATGWMALGGGNVHFHSCDNAECTPRALRTVSANGGESSLLHELAMYPAKIAFGGAYVIHGEWFVPLDGTAPTNLLASLDGGFNVHGVAADEQAVYVADHPSGRILTAAVTLGTD